MINGKKSKKQLIEELEAYHRLFDITQLGYLSLDQSGYIIEINKACCGIMGYSRDEVLNKNISEFLHPDYYKHFIESIAQLKNLDSIPGVEIEMVNKDGSEIVVSLDVNIDRRENGSYDQIYCTLKNITKDKLAKEELEKNLKLINDMLDAIPDMAWLKDANGIYLMCNREFSKLVNSSKEQIIGATDYDIFPAKKADLYRENDLRAIEDGIPITNEELADYVTSGDSILLETTRTPIYDNQGELIGVLGIGQDISRNKEALQESLRKQEFLNLVLESSPVPMWIGSPDGTTLRANQALYSTLNLTPEQIVGRYNLLQDDNLKRADIAEKIDLLFNEKQSVKFDLEWKIDRAGDTDFSGGRDLYIDVTIFPLLDQNGAITHIVVQWIDVTDHIKAEEVLKVQERFISAIADTSPAIIYVYDMKSNRNVYINTGIERLLGYSVNEIQDMGENVLSDLVHPDDFPDVLKIHSEISTATDEAVHTIEYRMKHRDGTWRYLHSDERVFLRNSDGSVKQKIGVAHDITERKTLEDNLIRSEARYHKAQEIGRVGNWEYNLRTKQFWGSDEAKHIYGFDPRKQDFTTEEVENCIPDRENVHQALIDLIEREQPYNLEFEIITKDTG